MKRILIIEDDDVIRDELATLLKNNGYEVFTALDFTGVISEVNRLSPHLILLDINLPVRDGYRICSDIRASSNIPVIFVTSRSTDMDELNGIITGGDDFITKPYNIPILLARITAILKRAYLNDEAGFAACNGLKLFSDAGKAEYQGVMTELTKNETKILSYLIKHQGKIVPREDLIEYLWDNQMYIDDNALSVNITRLRAKLEQIGIIGFIKTKHRRGYMV